MRFNLTYKLIFLSTLISILTLTLLLTSCEEPTSSGGGDDNASITLSVADVSCTEAWLHVTTEGVNFNNGATLTLLRDDSVRSNIFLFSADTVIYDEGLLPGKTYRYTARLTFTPTQTNESVTKESNAAEAVTMDTTSHEFTWETFTFGGANGSSYLSDVAIINENDIWAVGEIHTEDTDQWNEDSTEWIQPYNAVHWNGQEWELRRILWDGNYSGLRTILAFSENDIWFGDVNLFHWNGNIFEQIDIPNNVYKALQNSLWGVSSEDFYVVGDGGNIAHYQNGSWTKVESGTEKSILDITGDGENAYAVTCGDWPEDSGQILFIENDEVTRKVFLPDSLTGGYAPTAYSIWTKQGNKLFVGGYSFYSYLPGENKWQTLEYFPDRNILSISGNDYNDVFFTRDDGKVNHFNGVNDKRYFCGNGSVVFFGSDYKDEVFVSVGISLDPLDWRAFLFMGSR